MASNDSLTTSVTTVHPGRTLGECLGKYLDEQTDTDVSFIVGEDKVEVKAHRMVLQCRSPVFSRMLSQTFHDGGDIEIKDTPVDNFKTLIRFLYTDQADLNEENAIPVLHLADKYDVPLLYDRCVEFLNNNIKIKNACLIFAAAKRYNSETLKIASLSFICLNKDCLSSEEFLNLCREDVMDISGNENLSCREEHLLEGLCRWAEVRCNETGKEPNDTNKRQILGDLLFTVRFPLIHYEYLINILSKGELLSDSELKQVMQIRPMDKGDEDSDSDKGDEESDSDKGDEEADPDKIYAASEDSSSDSEAEKANINVEQTDTCTNKPNCNGIKGTARQAIQPIDIILATGSVVLSTGAIQEEQVISFTVSEDSWLYGVIMYGPTKATRFVYEMSIFCSEDSLKKLSVLKITSSFIRSNEKSYICAVPTESPLLLKSSNWYKCKILVFSNPSCTFYRQRDSTEIKSAKLPKQRQRSGLNFGSISSPGEVVVTHFESAVAEKNSSSVSDQHAFIEKTFRHKKLRITNRSCHIIGLTLY